MDNNLDNSNHKRRRTENHEVKGKFVITGETEKISRDVLESRLKEYGAQVTSGVSGMTNFLITGTKLEDGRDIKLSKKYEKAQQILNSTNNKSNLKIITESELYELYPFLADNTSEFPEFLQESAKNTKLTPNMKFRLWADRYRPVEISDFAGNTDLLTRIVNWLTNWPPPNNFNALLLAGSPGIGKTSSALAAGKLCNYKVIEFNASDTRNVNKLHELTDIVTGNSIMTFDNSVGKALILMDEVDGMSSGDRGGIQELTTLISKARHPLILTCNDSNSQKIKPLLRVCQTLQFRKCDERAAIKRVKEICALEKCNFDETLVKRCFEISGGDMRYFLNLCQVTLTFNEKSITTNKDFTNYDSLYMVVRKMFTEWKNFTYEQKLNSFYIDYKMIPLFVEENALKTLMSKNSPSLQQIINACTMLSAMSFGHVLNNKINKEGRWDLLQDYGLFTTIIPCNLVSPNFGVQIDFPSYLSSYSSRNKMLRIYNEAAYHCPCISPGSFVMSGYGEILGDIAFNEFSTNESAGMESLFQTCSYYKINTKEELNSVIFETRFKSVKNKYDELPARIKTAITKNFTKLSSVQKAPGTKLATPSTFSLSSSFNDLNDSLDEEKSSFIGADTASMY